MLKHVSGFPSFLRLTSTACCVHTTFCSSIHPSMDTWVASTFWLLWWMLLRTQMYRSLSETLFSIILGLYPEVELLDHLAFFFEELLNHPHFLLHVNWLTTILTNLPPLRTWTAVRINYPRHIQTPTLLLWGQAADQVPRVRHRAWSEERPVLCHTWMNV